jgi:hypothetical protein
MLFLSCHRCQYSERNSPAVEVAGFVEYMVQYSGLYVFVQVTISFLSLSRSGFSPQLFSQDVILVLSSFSIFRAQFPRCRNWFLRRIHVAVFRFICLRSSHDLLLDSNSFWFFAPASCRSRCHSCLVIVVNILSATPPLSKLVPSSNTFLGRDVFRFYAFIQVTISLSTSSPPGLHCSHCSLRTSSPCYGLPS